MMAAGSLCLTFSPGMSNPMNDLRRAILFSTLLTRSITGPINIITDRPPIATVIAFAPPAI